MKSAPRRGDRVHIRTTLKPADLFTLALGATVEVSSLRRAYLAYDDGTKNWCKIEYIFAGNPPESMRID